MTNHWKLDFQPTGWHFRAIVYTLSNHSIRSCRAQFFIQFMISSCHQPHCKTNHAIPYKIWWSNGCDGDFAGKCAQCNETQHHIFQAQNFIQWMWCLDFMMHCVSFIWMQIYAMELNVWKCYHPTTIVPLHFIQLEHSNALIKTLIAQWENHIDMGYKKKKCIFVDRVRYLQWQALTGHDESRDDFTLLKD